MTQVANTLRCATVRSTANNCLLVNSSRSVCAVVCRACIHDAEPLAAYGTSFNYTLWYVRLVGEDSPAIVESVVRDFDAVSACNVIDTCARVQYRYTQALRICLRFMREQDSVPVRQACDELQRQTGVTLEDDHPLGLLRRTIVDAGDIGAAEALVINDVERTCHHTTCL